MRHDRTGDDWFASAADVATACAPSPDWRAIIDRLEDRIFVPSRLYAFGFAFLLAYTVVFLLHIQVHDWPLAANGAPVFIDFISFWINARFALTAAAADAYNYATFAAAQARYMGAPPDGEAYFHLVYPPTLFPIIAPLGLVPFPIALAAWIVSAGGLYLRAVYRIVPYAVVCVLALVPLAVAKNVWLGQTGLFVAGLLGLSLNLMARRPFLAGMCLGLLTCKPQYGLIFPIVLIATGQWRMIAGACLTFAVLCFAATGLYGVDIWFAYLQAFGTTHLDTFMTDDGVYAIDQTVFGVMYWFEGGFTTNWIVHLVAAGLLTALVCAICRRPVSASLKAAALCIGALGVTPYMLAYDLTAVTVPVAFLVRDGLATRFLPGERMTFVGCFSLLFLMQEVPVGPVVLAALMILLMRRVRAFSARGADRNFAAPGLRLAAL